MNSKIEACRVCPIKCRLEDKSKDIVTKAKDQYFNQEQVRAAVSAMTLMTTKIPCPQSEIARIRRETFAQIDPRLEAQDSRFKYFETPKKDTKATYPGDFSRHPKNPQK